MKQTINFLITSMVIAFFKKKKEKSKKEQEKETNQIYLPR